MDKLEIYAQELRKVLHQFRKPNNMSSWDDLAEKYKLDWKNVVRRAEQLFRESQIPQLGDEIEINPYQLVCGCQPEYWHKTRVIGFDSEYELISVNYCNTRYCFHLKDSHIWRWPNSKEATTTNRVEKIQVGDHVLLNAQKVFYYPSLVGTCWVDAKVTDVVEDGHFGALYRGFYFWFSPESEGEKWKRYDEKCPKMADMVKELQAKLAKSDEVIQKLTEKIRTLTDGKRLLRDERDGLIRKLNKLDQKVQNIKILMQGE